MEVVMPQLGETVSEGTITVWHKKVGESVSVEDVLFEVSTDKVDTEIPAPASGVLTEIVVAEGETVNVGVRLAVIDDGGATTEETEKTVETVEIAETAPTEAPAAAQPSGDGSMKAVLSPVVSRLIAEHGLDASAIAGTGRDGRITRRDVLAAVDSGGGSAEAATPATPAGDDLREVIPFSRINKLTAEHMVRSKATSAHVLQAVEADFSAVEAARIKRGEEWQSREGFELTYLPFIASAVCRAIADFPNVNSSVSGDSLVVHRPVNLSIAVNVDFSDLVVPVIHDAEGKSVAELAHAIRDLALRARSDSLRPDDMSGGTYTISNNGSFGTMITAPIINQPQVAVLSTDGITRRPVVVIEDGEEVIAIRPVGVLAQSFDHRAITGAYSGAFLKRLKQIIEEHDWAGEVG
ncbi:MAG: dihydrolipoamide acetyltransferase family protein [Alphaproteobacteria bacterium]